VNPVLRCFYPGLIGLFLLLANFAGAAEPVVRPTTRATTIATTSKTNYGKDVVVMNELVDMYEAVPFEHRRHAEMAEMWDGCETCHHHSPTTKPTVAAVATARSHAPSQTDASIIPACKSCHPAQIQATTDINMPSLKGAYHRQCLSCHREWMGNNACLICHAARPTTAPTTVQITTTRATTTFSPDDIIGRMHKPIPAPTTKQYVTRFTPVAGPNVLFRHDEHAKDFGIRCVTCHRHDACLSCHQPAKAGTTTSPTTMTAPTTTTSQQTGSHPLQPGRTWRDTHGPCISCHQNDRCATCHYQDGQAPPNAFTHASTGQELDKDHAKLACASCHRNYKDATNLTCGTDGCHDEPVRFPKDRPGPYRHENKQSFAASQPTTMPMTTQPATRPTIIRIRRGGL